MKIKKERFESIVNEESDQVINEFLGKWLKQFGLSKQDKIDLVKQQMANAVDQIDASGEVPPDVKKKVIQTVIQDPHHLKILSRDLDHHDTSTYLWSIAQLLNQGTPGKDLKVSKVDIKTTADEVEETEPEPEGEGEGEEEAKTDEPVSLFTGQGALYQRLYSSLADAVGARSKRDKNDVEWVVKLIMKDLSAQLRYNKIKVQENQLIEALMYVLTEKQRSVRCPGAAKSNEPGIWKTKFKELEKLKGQPGYEGNKELLQHCHSEWKKQFKPGGAATDTVKSQKRVAPEKGILHVGKAAGNKLKHWKGGVLDQETITRLIVKKLKPFISKALKDRGREDVRIRENKHLSSIVEAIINEMQNTQ